MVLVQKWPLFQISFSVGNLGLQNVFYDILEQKKAFLGYNNRKFKKSKNSHFSKGVNPWFWSKNGHFLNLFFLGNIGKENMFYDLLERKIAFLGYKKRSLKRRKIAIFPKGLPMVLVQKWPFFQLHFFRQNRAGKYLFR